MTLLRDPGALVLRLRQPQGPAGPVIGAQGDRRISFLRPRSVGYPVGCPDRPRDPHSTPVYPP